MTFEDENPNDEAPGDESPEQLAQDAANDESSPFAHLPPLQRAHLAAYAHTGNLAKAARMVPMCRYNHYRWMSEPEYAAAFELAEKMAGDTLEAEAVRRAFEGVDEPVFRNEGCVGTVRKYSDRLLELLLRGAKRSKYSDRVEHAGRIDGTASQVHVFIPENGRDGAEAGETDAEPEGEPES